MMQRKMVKLIVSAVALSASVFGLNSGALAQTPSSAVTIAASDDPIAYYRAYEAAIARGDIEAASSAAVIAWQTGERVWNGNNANLPGLAYNAAWSLGLAGKINEAQTPARRAVAFAAQSPDKVNQREAAFLLAYAELMVSPSKGRVEAFDVAAKALDNGGWSDYLLARSYVDSSRIALNVALPRMAHDMADRGLAEVARAAPHQDGLRTSLMVLRTQSSLQLRSFGRAVNEVMEARRAYGPPKSERDANWASVVAWEAASRAVYMSIYGSSTTTGSRISRDVAPNEWREGEKEALGGGLAECRGIELKRKGPDGARGISFPRQEISDGYAGGALVRANLDSEGRVTGTDILASLPRPSFGTAAVSGIRTWTYELPADLPEQCRVVDVVIVYAFGG